MNQQITAALFDITVTDDAGDVESVSINGHVKLSELLRKGLKALYGEPGPTPSEYVLMVSGVLQEDLDKTLIEAGLASGSEVAILKREIPRG
jgi:hypothetical protein